MLVFAGILAALGTAGAGIGTLSEMSALQTRPATQVAPIVLALTTLVPVALAPVLASETWSGDPWVKTALVASLALIVAGAVSLGTSRSVGSVLEPEATRSRSETGLSDDAEISDRAREIVATAERGVPPSVTSTMSPRVGVIEDNEESSRTAPDTALPP